jgi:hypothetical protein
MALSDANMPAIELDSRICVKAEIPSRGTGVYCYMTAASSANGSPQVPAAALVPSTLGFVNAAPSTGRSGLA